MRFWCEQKKLDRPPHPDRWFCATTKQRKMHNLSTIRSLQDTMNTTSNWDNNADKNNINYYYWSILCGKKDLFDVQYPVIPPGATRIGTGLHDCVVTVVIGAHPHNPCLLALARQQGGQRWWSWRWRRPDHLVEPLGLRTRIQLPPQCYPVHDFVVMTNNWCPPCGHPLWVPVNVIVSVAIAPPS